MDYMAMGSYPYPSSYILNGDGFLPAYPMREMCKRIVGRLSDAPAGGSKSSLVEASPKKVPTVRNEPPDNGVGLAAIHNDVQLVEALVAGVGVF